MNYTAAIKIAEAHALTRGFKRSAASNQSLAVYLEHPEYDGLLRIAEHDMRHSFGVVASVEFTDDETPAHMRPKYGYDASNMDASDVCAALNEAISVFFSEAEKIEEDETDA